MFSLFLDKMCRSLAIVEDAQESSHKTKSHSDEHHIYSHAAPATLDAGTDRDTNPGETITPPAELRSACNVINEPMDITALN